MNKAQNTKSPKDNFELTRKKKKINKARNTFISVLLLLCIFIVGVYVCYEKYFVIEKIIRKFKIYIDVVIIS